jgi:hypothetical protein
MCVRMRMRMRALYLTSMQYNLFPRRFSKLRNRLPNSSTIPTLYFVYSIKNARRTENPAECLQHRPAGHGVCSPEPSGGQARKPAGACARQVCRVRSCVACVFLGLGGGGGTVKMGWMMPSGLCSAGGHASQAVRIGVARAATALRTREGEAMWWWG